MPEQRRTPERVLLVGGGAREHVIGEAICQSGDAELLTIAGSHNPGLAELSASFVRHDERDVEWIAAWAREQAVDLAVIGLEDPLEAGIADALNNLDIPTVGPTKEAARVETSKLFTRELMRSHNIPGQVDYRYFSDPEALARFLGATEKHYALKPVGLTAGKGVKVMGVQLDSVEEAIDYGRRVIEGRIGGTAGLVVEERLIGDEFTLQTFVDGVTVLPMPLVKDYKRLLEGDQGPNTGSMGSYSQADGLLWFLREDDRRLAVEILRQVVAALAVERHPYRGIMYGQFMKTSEGVKLVEINARFGDPEAMNVLPLLENDFLDVCQAITTQRLHELELRFSPRATVCKYITPPGYGFQPRVDVPLTIDRAAIDSLGARLYFARVNEADGCYLTTTSRSVALVGVAESLERADSLVERALDHVKGDYHVRHDIARDAVGRQNSQSATTAVLRIA